jgi:hypothetical protein
MHWISPRDRAGLSTLEASIAPSAPPAPTERVQLVDEQDDVLGAAHLVHHRLDALLELAAVLGARDHHGQVEHDQALVLEHLGHLAGHDVLRQALDDGGLADARLAQQHGVVLRAPAQDLDHALDLVLAADDRVEVVLARELGEVAAEGVERRGLALGAARAGLAAGLALLGPAAAGRLAAAAAAALAALLRLLAALRRAQELEHLLAHVLELDAQVREHAGRDALALLDQAQQQVLGADVVVAELAGFLEAELEHLLGARREGQVAHRHHGRAALDELLDLGADALEVDAHVPQHVGRDAAALLHQAEQDVLGADVLVVQALRLALGEVHDLAGAVGEAVEHGVPLKLG